MKPSNLKYRHLFPTVVLILLVTSCTSTKYAALPCPDLPQAPKTKEIKIPKNFKIFASRPFKNNKTRINRRNSKKSSNRISPFVQVRKTNSYDIVNGLSGETNNANIIFPPQINIHNLPPPSEEYYINVIEDVELKPSAMETNYSIVKSLSPYIPKYSPSEITMLKSTNSYQDSIPRIEGLGLAGFVAGILGIFIAGIPLGIIAIVFGAVSLSKIKKNPQKFSGRGFALTSLILGIVDVTAVVLLLLLFI